MGRTARRGLVVLAMLAPATLTGVAALAGLLSAGTDAPCGKLCSGTSPDASTEAWLIALFYVQVLGAFCVCRVMAETDMTPATMPAYRGSLGALGAGSLLFAIVTPGSWEPLRPALMIGGLSGLTVLVAGGHLASLVQPQQQDRHEPRGDVPEDASPGPIEAGPDDGGP